METFSDYILQQKILDARSFTVYRGRRKDEPQSVYIRVLKTKQPSPSEIARFKQGFNLVRNLNIDGILKNLALVEHNHSFATIEEDFDGIPLNELIRTRRIDIPSFLLIALKLSDTLGAIHGNGVIHLGIKPHNILVNVGQGTAKIMNFGFSAEFTHANDEIYNPDVIRQTLVYMSPEQTGRMNRSVDHRTDLYSLGVTFYEMLTGDVPFKSTDPLEVIHSHIARLPASPCGLNPTIPPVVSDIVLKLLSKTPEERYQNGLGLAADIGVCLDRFDTKNAVDEFTLGTRDISVEFNIPRIIVGREKELETIMESFERASTGAREMLLVLGQPGIGKSALINEIHKPIVAKRGYFISGKYDQLGRDVPYSAIIQAFQGLVRQILTESEVRIGIWKNKLLSVLGANGKVIINVIPELEYIIGTQPDVPNLNPEESRHRFNLAFQNFIHVFATGDHPLAVFLDDLQWADMSSLSLIKASMTGHETQYLFLIGAYRDGEVDRCHPLSITLDEIRQTGKTIHCIVLGPLGRDNVNTMIMNALRCGEKKTIDLAEVVHKKTAGNPFFVNQFLKNLYDAGVLEVDLTTGWKWDTKKVEQMQFAENVVELMARKISSLPEKTRDMLKICACIGNGFDLELLSVVSGKSIEETLADLTLAIQEGLVYFNGDKYEFHHDRIQEAAYSLIADDEKAEMHYMIGNSMLMKTDLADPNAKIFDIVDQLNRGIAHVANYGERLNLLELNVHAANKAKKSAAYMAAADYYGIGKSLLSPEVWTSLPHNLFELSIQHAECVFLSGDSAKALALCDELFRIATDVIDKGLVYELKAKILEFMGEKFESIIDEIRNGLELFNISLPEDHQVIDQKIREGIDTMQGHFKRIPIKELVNLPQMKDQGKIMAMNLLFQAVPPSIQSYPPLFILIELMMFDLAVHHGTTAVSCKNFVDCGIIYGSILGDYDSSYKLGEAAFALMDKYGAESLKSSVYYVFSVFISHWKVHYQESLDYFNLSYRFGLETGDIQHTAYCCAYKVHRFLYIGRNIEECRQEAENAIVFLKKWNAVIQLSLTDNFLNVILKLLALPDGKEEADFAKRDDDLLEDAKKFNNIFCFFALGQGNAMVNYLLDDIEAAEKWNAFTEPFIQGVAGCYSLPDHHLFQSLILTKTWRGADAREREAIMETLLKNRGKLKFWSENCPANFLHKYYLVCAEISAVRGKPLKTVASLYAKALDSIGKGDFIHMRALIQELQGYFWMSRGYDRIGQMLIREAHRLYAQWGALAKVANMEKKYPYLVPDSPQKNGDDTTKVAEPSLEAAGSRSLDLNTVIRVSQLLSREINLERLLSTIMKLSVENAGAQRGLLVLESKGRLTVEAVLEEESEAIEAMQSIPLEKCDRLSVAIVNYAYRSGKNVILEDAARDGAFIHDPYIKKNGCKSILCSPIMHQGKITGILYMENNLVDGAFTPERLELLDIISSQAAISIQNATLYLERMKAQKEIERYSNNLETMVQERTVELEQALDHLKEAQLKLFQSEKMASLGQLAAGMAHEINNPMAFISGNLYALRRYCSRIIKYLSAIDEMSERYEPGFRQLFVDKGKDSQIKAVIEDLSPLIEESIEGVNRVSRIISNLRGFVRPGQNEAVTADVNSCIDLTLGVCRNEIQAKAEIHKDFGILPLTTCYPQQLNQVFLNLLINAAQAIETKGDIFIKTWADEGTIHITIRDTGQGIDPEQIQRVFEPFYTTREVSQGTGLGLSISYDIIRKHNGDITVQSRPGEGTTFEISIPVLLAWPKE